MSTSSLMDVAVGMMFIFILLSVTCSAITEWISALMSKRAIQLEKAIRHLLDDPDLEKDTPKQGGYATVLANSLFKHPLIDQLSPRGKLTPAYIPSRTFAIALMDIIVPPGEKPAANIAELKTLIERVESKQLKKTLTALVMAAEDDLGAFRKSIESWFDDAMER